MQITKYRSAYRENCIQIFKSNLPTIFANEELQQFEEFLDQMADHYYVVKISDRLVGCGGIFFDDKKNEAGLSWGMVDANYHGQGIGKLLTQFRLELLEKLYADKMIKIETSQHTAKFYQKNGFKIVDIIADGFSGGLDKYTMKIDPNTK
ncbi:putative GNAT family N-acyltransferase [Chryseobacterium sp. H1D6B]|uniref:GNAT family N-acetyltransferase n=1 Tax=Chryseobacterium sp. H1D6B TaxID=2940588 RepID=UPI0015C8478C|nr:GNAT family N-acetyltransferase [Chryseobacterium sp. H1D6B]MDH6252411.1 putative GNAT family N-acyltransferase [Chryseobacterium sp. H1D6B]